MYFLLIEVRAVAAPIVLHTCLTSIRPDAHMIEETHKNLMLIMYISTSLSIVGQIVGDCCLMPPHVCQMLIFHVALSGVHNYYNT